MYVQRFLGPVLKINLTGPAILSNFYCFGVGFIRKEKKHQVGYRNN